MLLAVVLDSNHELGPSHVDPSIATPRIDDKNLSHWPRKARSYEQQSQTGLLWRFGATVSQIERGTQPAYAAHTGISRSD